MSFSAWVSSSRFMRSARLMLGTTRPRGVAAAMPRFTSPCSTISSVASSKLELISGLRAIARQAALANTSSGETRRPENSRRCLRISISSMVPVTSTSVNAVACGTFRDDGHRAEHLAADPLQRHAPVAGERPPALRCRDDVLRGDRAARTGTRHPGQVDPEVACDASHRRLRQRRTAALHLGLGTPRLRQSFTRRAGRQRRGRGDVVGVPGDRRRGVVGLVHLVGGGHRDRHGAGGPPRPPA